MKNFATVALITGFIILGVGCEVKLWGECRETNSFWYCMRVLGK